MAALTGDHQLTNREGPGSVARRAARRSDTHYDEQTTSTATSRSNPIHSRFFQLD